MLYRFYLKLRFNWEDLKRCMNRNKVLLNFGYWKEGKELSYRWEDNEVLVKLGVIKRWEYF